MAESAPSYASVAAVAISVKGTGRDRDLPEIYPALGATFRRSKATDSIHAMICFL